MSRLEWILTGLLAILVIFVLALLLLFWSEQRQAENFNRQVATQQGSSARLRGTAQSAYEVVEPAARSWAADAVLLRARGNWPVGAAFEPAQGSWSFLFYSPGRRAVALIVPDGSNGRVVSESETEQRFDPAGLQRWQVDSPDVVEQLLANGGHGFIAEHGETSLIVALNAMDRLVWTATLNATRANKLFRLEIDPATGQIIAQPADQASQ